MKKTFLVITLVVITLYSYACEICGCSSSNFYTGLLPNFKHRFIGMRYSHMRLHTSLTNDTSQFSNNYYQTVELWSGWNIGKKWQLLTFIPYHFNKQIDDDGKTFTNGIGDISFLANYQLFYNSSVNLKDQLVEQELYIGAGIKLPTGKFNIDVNDPSLTVADVNAQIGTGSTDLLLNALYNIKISNFGINALINYKYNTAREGYKFGNKLIAGSFLYYRFHHRGMGISPNLGISYQHTSSNQLNTQKINYTGGYAITASIGAELTFKKMAIGCNFENPLKQDFAANQTILKNKAMIHISFAL